MSGIVTMTADGEPRVASFVIAERTENQHASVLRVIRDNLDDFEAFGRVGFEIAPFETAGGTQRREIAMLNEQQATLLMTFMRNSEIVKAFKIELVKQFYKIRQALVAQTPVLSDEQIVARALEITTRKVAELEARVEVLEPAAVSWQTLASAEGDYPVGDAAKMLARAGIDTGPQRLFEYLASIKWIYRGSDSKWRAYAEPVSRGFLAERPQSHYHPKTGELVLDAPQVRVTVPGLDRLRQRMQHVVEVSNAFA
ncbi:phage regulatory protein/antirepressor Ant [Pseudoclavibacter alba]|uniref:Phage regulatory protein/antirepressor Ant n=1 Tax=Pseudoclavibacter albus TaxID=272241 RepID=A0ABT2HWE7_9MICO|nr:phage regulatory protein/antirepressor Ant [Pseudoclavibacter alba]MCT2042642.1 phage regulatory protein/antirepressor Ant [Pseudoclavibacter alba]